MPHRTDADARCIVNGARAGLARGLRLLQAFLAFQAPAPLRVQELGVLGPDMVMIHMGWASPREILAVLNDALHANIHGRLDREDHVTLTLLPGTRGWPTMSMAYHGSGGPPLKLVKTIRIRTGSQTAAAPA